MARWSLICMVFLLMLLSCAGQELSLMMTPTYNDLLGFRDKPENPDQQVNPGFGLSLQYDRVDGENFFFGPGICYQFSQVSIAPDSTQPEDYTRYKAQLLSLNFRLGFPIGEGYFLALDPFIEMQLNSNGMNAIENQGGFGFSVAALKKFYVSDVVFLVVEPRIWFHSVLPFYEQEPRMRLVVGGLNLGIGLY